MAEQSREQLLDLRDLQNNQERTKRSVGISRG